MLILRLNHAQHAIADGRLEEACEILSESAARQHRKGQELIGKLITQLLQRGKDHLAGERFREALADCDRAAKFSRNQDEVVLLREQALSADRAAAKKADRRKHALATAKRHIERGEIELGHAVCDELPNGTTVANLKKEAGRREELIENRLQRVERALNNAEYTDAIQGLRELKSMCPQNERFVALLSSVGRAIVDQANAAIDNGLLVNAVDAMDRIYGLVQSDAAADCRRSIELCQRVAANLGQPDLRSVIADLRHLEKQRPGAQWIPEAIEAAVASNEARDRLNASPLSSLPTAVRTPVAQVAPTNAMKNYANDKSIVMASLVPRNGKAIDSPVSSPSGLTDAFVLQVDGASSCLVANNSTVTFGPRSSSRRNDIEVLGPSAAQVELHREDGDYFLRSNQPVVVNNRATESKLLSHGDRIELGPRSSLRFSLPCAASTSAVIELSGCKTPNGGCRRLVMLDNALVIASNGASHVRSSIADEPFVLFIRDGRLQARPMNGANGSTATDTVVLDLDIPVVLGDMNVVASSVNVNRNRKV